MWGGCPKPTHWECPPKIFLIFLMKCECLWHANASCLDSIVNGSDRWCNSVWVKQPRKEMLSVTLYLASLLHREKQ